MSHQLKAVIKPNSGVANDNWLLGTRNYTRATIKEHPLLDYVTNVHKQHFKGHPY